MDELRISTRLMRGIVSKLVSKAVSKKFGYDIVIQMNEIEVKNEDGKVRIHANVDAECNSDEFVKIVKSIGLE